MNKDQDMAIVQQAVDRLREHFDCVQVFCSRHNAEEGGSTTGAALGAGNDYSRYGQVRHWLLAQERETQSPAIDHE